MKQSDGLYPYDRRKSSPVTFPMPVSNPVLRRRSNRTLEEPGIIAEYLQIVRRWWKAILYCALAGAAISLLMTLNTRPIYRARTSLDVKSINSDFLNMRSVAATGDGISSSSEYYVQTVIKLLQSTTVLDRTVERLKAEKHPDVIDANDTVSVLKRMAHLTSGDSLTYASLVDDAAKRVAIKPLGMTRLVEITCDSWDPEFSAKFCNTLTEQFKESDLETRSAEAQKTSEFLTHQLADVRLKAEESQKKLETATGGDGLVLSQESNSIAEDRIRQLQGELVRAQTERIEKESQLRTALSAQPDSVSAVLDSPIYRQYQQTLADLKTKVAEIVPPLTEEHPKVVHLRSQIKEVQSGMNRERTTILGRLRNDFESARHHEDLLNTSYAALRSSVSVQMSKTERVSLLRRDVESERQLYQTLLQRAKEAGFASAMQTATMRVVDPATGPKTAISPKRGTATMVGLFFGSLCGVGFALFKTRTANVFHLPGEAEQHLHVHELGVIPSAAFQRSKETKINTKTASLINTAGQDSLPPALFCWKEHFSLVAEAFRNVTHSILLAGALRRQSRVYVVTSPNAGEGKTTVTTNLGIALSKAKLRILIVDGDMRKPGLHKNLFVENSFGLRNLLRDEIDITAAPVLEICKQTAIPNLWLMPAGVGKEEVVELLHSKTASVLLKRLTSEFDVVLIDTPPMLHMADARILGTLADGVILVLRAGLTGRDDAADACDRFDNDRVPIIGTILNDFDAAREGKTSYYKSYYRYAEQTRTAEHA